MAACLWYALCLPAFFIPALSIPGRDVPCVDSRFDSCEGRYRRSVRVASEEGFGLPFFQKMCASIEELSTCTTAECEDLGHQWNPEGDYVTKMLQFSKDNGLCGGIAKTNDCSQRIAKTCLKKMAEEVEKRVDVCGLYFFYAKCAIDLLPACTDTTATAFAAEMKRQVLEKMPFVVDNEITRHCSWWSALALRVSEKITE